MIRVQTNTISATFPPPQPPIPPRLAPRPASVWHHRCCFPLPLTFSSLTPGLSQHFPAAHVHPLSFLPVSLLLIHVSCLLQIQKTWTGSCHIFVYSATWSKRGNNKCLTNGWTEKLDENLSFSYQLLSLYSHPSPPFPPKPVTLLKDNIILICLMYWQPWIHYIWKQESTVKREKGLETNLVSSYFTSYKTKAQGENNHPHITRLNKRLNQN